MEACVEVFRNRFRSPVVWGKYVNIVTRERQEQRQLFVIAGIQRRVEIACLPADQDSPGFILKDCF